MTGQGPFGWFRLIKRGGNELALRRPTEDGRKSDYNNLMLKMLAQRTAC